MNSGTENDFQIITFYEFRHLSDLPRLKNYLKDVMAGLSITGTIIIAGEGYNGSICGERHNIEGIIPELEKILDTPLTYKSSFHAVRALQRIKVKIKPEIVTLRERIEIGRGAGTHVKPRDWNEIISDPEVFLLDTRNDYEYQVGTFRNAVNPKTEKFSDLPGFVAENMDPEKHHKVAMFCTGGIRCEKFAPFMKGLGFEKVYQLEGGILKYLEEIPEGESLWEGECFVFDERITVDEDLQKGNAPDLSPAKRAALK
jgi:UPF0176 protein